MRKRKTPRIFVKSMIPRRPAIRDMSGVLQGGKNFEIIVLTDAKNVAKQRRGMSVANDLTVA
jgi:hypothetical protein